MRYSTLLAGIVLAGTTLVVAEPMPYKLETYGSMSSNPAYGLMKRKDGYQPTEVRCGPGADCATSCGTNYIQCPSNDGAMHCYDPTVKKETCCTDGNGHACRDGYFCTSDSSGGTWCCPEGMDLVTCAKNYHLTDSLVSQSATATPSPYTNSSSTSADASVPTPSANPTYTSYYYNTTYYPNTTYTAPDCTKSCHATATYYPPIGTGTGIGTGTAPTGAPTSNSTVYVPPAPTVPATTPSSTPPPVVNSASTYTAALPLVLVAAIGFAIAF